MTQKRHYIFLTIIVLVLASSTTAVDNYLQKKQDKREIHQDKKESRATSAALNRLSSTIDRWVEANLKGHNKKARGYEKSILEQIQADIVFSRQQLERYETEVRSSAKEYNRPHQSTMAGHGDRADLHDDAKDLHLARQLLKEKERLASALRKVGAFSNRYRLLGDYMDVMRREQGITKVELVEDAREFREDREERRKE